MKPPRRDPKSLSHQRAFSTRFGRAWYGTPYRRLRSSLVHLALVLSVGSAAYAQLPRAGSEFQVNTRINFVQKNPAPAVSPGGDFVVAWQDYLDGLGLAVLDIDGNTERPRAR